MKLMACGWAVLVSTRESSIFEGQPPQNKAFSNQNKGPHLGSRYIYIYKIQDLPGWKTYVNAFANWQGSNMSFNNSKLFCYLIQGKKRILEKTVVAVDSHQLETPKTSNPVA